MIDNVRSEIICILSAFILCSNSLAKEEKQQNNPQMKIAIIEFVASESDNALSGKLFNIFHSKMKKYKNWEMIPMSDIKDELKKIGYKTGEDIPSEQLMAIGENLKAYYVVYSKLNKQRTFYTLDTSIVNIEYKKESKCRITVFKDVNDVKDIEDQLERLTVSIQDRKDFFDMVKKSTDLTDELTNKTPQQHLDRIKALSESFGDPDKYILQPGLRLHGGYNYLLSGYRDYTNNYTLGAELRFRMIFEDKKIGLFGFYVSIDESPMIVPSGTYGVQEDIINLNFGATFGLFPQSVINPYIGFGVGLYFDWLRYDTPATGALSSFHTFLGIDPRAGIELGISNSIKFAPELRVHLIFTPAKQSYVTSHASALGGLLIYF